MKLSIITTFFSLTSHQFSHAQQLSEECTIVAVSDVLTENFVEDDNYEETLFVCHREGINDLFISLPTAEKEHMKKLIDDGDLVINESTILKNKDIVIEGNKIISLGILPWSLGRRTPKTRRRPEQGNKPILAVKVTDVNGLSHPDNAATIGDNIFGTLGDPVNLKSQMFACSFGQLNIVTEYTQDISEHEAAPGVIEVKIPISLTVNDRYTIHDAVTVEVERKLGFTLPGPFEQVMYILEKCYVGCGWAAYAYVNSWMSVYQGAYYSHAGVQMHEIGHNFGFAHSGGLNGATYTDHTCAMGNPLYGDDLGKMCFNPAKNWAIGWYDSRKNEVNINNNVINHVETIVGIADFDNNPEQRNVIIKLETGTSNDYFVGFNRAIGVNSQNDEADNEVTIVLTGNDGVAYSQSFLQATLKQGEYWALNGMVITADEINIESNPATAKVSIMKGVTSQPPVVTPTASPIASPIASPTASPITSPIDHPSASPVAFPTALPVVSPVHPPTSSPVRPPTECKTLCCYPIDINENGGWANDYMLGVCANKGCHYEMWPNGSPYCSGSSYHTCMTDNCTSPTNSPVMTPSSVSPVSSPTKQPTPSTCSSYKKSGKCKRADCYWVKSLKTCFASEPLCPVYNKAKSCKRADCFWENESKTCLTEKPCSAFNRKGACKRAGCDWDKTSSTCTPVE